MEKPYSMVAVEHAVLPDKGASEAAVVEAVMNTYEDSKFESKELDKQFVWPEDNRPDISHDEFDVEIPVVDLSPVLKLRKLRQERAKLNASSHNSLDDQIRACEAEQATIEKEIRSACEACGFFQIVNHGFPVELAEQITECYREIFDLPLEEKLKVQEEIYEGALGKPGYTPITRSTPYTKINDAHIWNEGFDMESPEQFFPGRLEELSKILYPEGSELRAKGVKLTSTAREYGRLSSDLSKLLLELVAGGFGLPANVFEGILGCSNGEEIMARLRINHYPVCSRPDMTWGVYNHTDATFLTVLHQDSVGGLQVGFRDGTWHGLRPIPGAFVVNVGDLLQAVTNGRSWSAEHRVVANDKSRRFSVAYFVLTRSSDAISPRPELVDEEHPLLYKPFTQTQYFENVLTKGISKGSGQVLNCHFAIDS